jgi:4-amino-4-deoxy-L-arabinose transferase-like glycosyltransferase
MMDQSVLEQTSSPRAVRSKWILFTALGLLVCVVSSLVIFPRIAKTEFSADEAGWISSGYYYTTLAQKRDLDWDKWFCRECQGFGRLNLHVGEFLFGIPMKMEKDSASPAFFGFYDVERSYEWNFRAGAVPPPAILIQAREVAAFFGVLCCLMIFAVGFWAYSPWVGLIASGLLLTNSVFLKLSGQAMTDDFYNFFLLSICMALVITAKVHNKKAIFALVCLTGVLTALACSVKITGLLLGTGFFLGLTGWRFWRARAGTKEMALTLAAFFVCCFGTVYLLNPFFWPSWNQLRGSEVVREAKSFSHDVSTKKIVLWHRQDLSQATFDYPQLRNLSHPVEFPLLFGRWNHELRRHLDAGLANWNGNRLVRLHQTLFQLSVPLGPDPDNGSVADVAGLAVNGVAFLLAVLTVAGVYFLAVSARSKGTNVVLLVALCVNYLLIVLFMGLNWDRYYLPTMISVALVAGVGFYEIARRAIHVTDLRRVGNLSVKSKRTLNERPTTV